MWNQRKQNKRTHKKWSEHSFDIEQHMIQALVKILIGKVFCPFSNSFSFPYLFLSNCPTLGNVAWPYALLTSLSARTLKLSLLQLLSLMALLVAQPRALPHGTGLHLKHSNRIEFTEGGREHSTAIPLFVLSFIFYFSF